MEHLHALARKVAAELGDPDRKQLRFNEIVETALLFYPGCAHAGVTELVNACDRRQRDLYDRARPMWQELNVNYRWMIPA
jgi:hypothetical protein